MAGKKLQPAYHCGMCDLQFISKAALTAHTNDHVDSSPTKFGCPVCSWQFDDSLSLEDHKILNGHDTPRFTCETCGKGFVTPRSLEEHKKPPYQCSQALTGGSSSIPTKAGPSITCDRCAKAFKNRQEYDSHRSFKTNGPCADHNHKTPPRNRVGYRDPGAPKKDPVSELLGYASSDEQHEVTVDTESEAPTNLSEGDIWCSQCKNRFKSLARHAAHTLWCFTKHGSTEEVADINNMRQTSEAIQPPLSATSHPGNQANYNRAPSQQSNSGATFSCKIQQCEKVFRSEAGLRQHKVDSHGVGGRGLDLMGNDSWMLPQRVREQARNDGRLRGSLTSPVRGGRGGHPPPMARALQHVIPSPIPAFGTPRPHKQQPPIIAAVQIPHAQLPVNAPVQLPSRSHNVGGVLEMEQAKYIQGKILRLLIQSDIFIHHDGKMSVSGIHWTRIGVERQPDVIGMFDAICHLPKALQGEYLPAPNAFNSDYKVPYPASEFESSTARDRNKPGLGVVALACGKVVLADGLQEIVKIAAVDLVTCRVLLNHFICTSGTAQVKNWRSNETGLFSWNDMEQARKLGYKVFRGWSAARSALSKFIDKETIIVGHNLRSDLDCLRMVHGRAVDIAKVAEKAARGPLAKPQLSLESLCRDLPAVALTSDPKYGRDMLMNAFAVREMGLWLIKNTEAFERKLRQKSLDYQVIMPRTAAA
jgi:hypothetical protein